MKLEILMSCMFQTDDTLVQNSNITGSATVINQCDREDYKEYPTKYGLAKIYSTLERGLCKSRNMAIEKSDADICMLCDDDEVFADNYEELILKAYEEIPDADIIIFNMINRPAKFENKVARIKFPKTMRVSSWRISFKRESLIKKGIRFDELLGAGSGNGAEEELKFMVDSEKAGLKIYYCPEKIATVAQEQSTWFEGFNEQFFENRGGTTRYILGLFPALAYSVYYILRKKDEYGKFISPAKAFKAILRGIKNDKITKLRKGS